MEQDNIKYLILYKLPIIEKNNFMKLSRYVVLMMDLTNFIINQDFLYTFINLYNIYKSEFISSL